MRSSERLLVAALLAASLAAVPARAQPAQGFALDRLYPSAPGGGWFVLDELALHGRLGGNLKLDLDLAGNPLRVTDGTTRLAVVSLQVSARVGAALTYNRWRFYLDLDMPLVATGESGTVGGVAFTAPDLDPAAHPDPISDVRLGIDVRFVGRWDGPFRMGAGAQLYVPFGPREDYATDGTVRGALRLLFAGDASYFTYAAQLGVHVRPLDDAPLAGSPRGSELLYAVAVGARIPLGRAPWSAVVGPEIFGASAFGRFGEAGGTALEGLLSGRFESTRRGRAQVRVRLGVGTGLHQRFGAPTWRVLVGVEVFGRQADPP